MFYEPLTFLHTDTFALLSLIKTEFVFCTSVMYLGEEQLRLLETETISFSLHDIHLSPYLSKLWPICGF